jgi:HK97 family phage portal protein
MAKTARKPTKKRSSLQRPEQWLMNALGAVRDTSGESVTETTALGLSVYFDCIRAIAEDVAKLPLILYRRLERGKERFQGHPVYRLLHDAPCPESTAFAFRETLTAHALGWGNGYAEIQRDGSGKVVALWPIDPSTVTVMRNDYKEIVYEVRNEVGDKTVLSADSVLHVHGLGYSSLVGYSVAKLARSSLGGAIAAQKYAGSFFGNGAMPTGVLQHPGALSDKALKHLRESWAERHGGAGNAHKPAILEEGMSWNNTTIPPEDAQLLETRQWHVEDICRWFRVPPSKVGHLLRAQGWSTLEQTNADYLTDSLMPWLVRWEQEIARKLIPDQDRETLFVEHLVDALLRTDTQVRFAAYGSAILNGWMSRNEVRERENLNPADGLDEFLQPTAAQTVSQAEEAAKAAARPPEPPPPPSPDEPDGENTAFGRMISGLADAHRPLLAGVYDRLRGLENDKLERAAKKGDVREFAIRFYPEHEAFIQAALLPTVRAFVSASVNVVGMDAVCKAEGLIHGHVRGMAKRWADARLQVATYGGSDPDVGLEMDELVNLVHAMRRTHGNASLSGHN